MAQDMPAQKTIKVYVFSSASAIPKPIEFIRGGVLTTPTPIQFIGRSQNYHSLDGARNIDFVSTGCRFRRHFRMR